MSRRGRRVICALLVAVLVPLSGASAEAREGPPGASGSRCDSRPNDTVEELQECVTLAGVLRHLRAFQRIADAHNGNRFSGLPGYDASADYVVGRLEAAGYDPVVQPFDYLAFLVHGPSALEQTAPGSVAYTEDVDFAPIDQSDPGDVTAPVTPVDVQLGLGNASTSGCEAEDFAGFPPGDVALIQRGLCSFADKARNAAAAGASAMVIFNQGNTTAPTRQNIPTATLTDANQSGIPVLGTTYALGAELVGTSDLAMRVFVNATRETRTTYNVLAETSGGDDGDVVMVGAHLDSVRQGPGINDNGSSSAAILEVATQMRQAHPANTVRFAWWGAEESGTIGSTHYVADLSAEERAAVAVYLNFDVIGSPNYVRFVYDGDGSAFGVPGPEGSAAIEALYEGFYADRGLASEPTPIDRRSDYNAFMDAGIPFGGVFSGWDGIKTPAQQATYGGVAGQQHDPCYHLACDNLGNVNGEVLDLNSDAVAYSTLVLATATDVREVVGGESAATRPGTRSGQAPSAAAPTGAVA
jgi:Zn-dependent M28 family amino/carboxypeptidase